MFSPRLRNALAAVAVCIPFNASSHNQISTAPEPRTTPNLHLTSLPPQRPLTGKFACSMQILSYFDDTSLHVLNHGLGRMKGWLQQNKLYDETLIEQFLDEGAPLDEEEKLAAQRFYGLYQIDAVYDAGQAAGYEYLKRNPVNVLKATSAYIDHMEVLKSMLSEDLAQELHRKFANPLKSFNELVIETQNMIDRQAEMGCDIPTPEHMPIPAPSTAPVIAR